MKADEVLGRDDFKKCLDFHGHLCPGLSIGYRATVAGMEWLRENRSEDEELVAIVENDACGVDAVQVLAGCTFGKGNFIFRDHGKQVFSFVTRGSGKGVRIALKAGAFVQDDRHLELIGKMRASELSDAEWSEFREMHRRKSLDLLEKPLNELFELEPVEIEIPSKARIERSKVCDACGEPTMASKTVIVGDKCLCRTCSSSV